MGRSDKMRFETLLLVFGMAIVTFIPRFLPMALLTKWTIPEKIKLGLEYIPVAVLTAIVFPILFWGWGETFGLQPRFLLAGLPVFIFARKVRSLWASVVLGMLIFWVLGFVL